MSWQFHDESDTWWENPSAWQTKQWTWTEAASTQGTLDPDCNSCRPGAVPNSESDIQAFRILLNKEKDHTSHELKVGHKRAHDVLSKLRTDMSSKCKPGCPSAILEHTKDLSSGEIFDWRNYVANHPESDLIIGTGITAFQAMFLEHSTDKNMGMARFDFVVTRTDGSSVRLHPSASKHGKPVVQGQSREVDLRRLSRCKGFVNRSQQDVIGRSSLQRFLNGLVTAWEASEPPRGPFFVELKTEVFDWVNYLNSTEWGRSLNEKGVHVFAAIWLHEQNKPAVYIEMLDKQQFVIDPDQKPEKALRNYNQLPAKANELASSSSQ